MRGHVVGVRRVLLTGGLLAVAAGAGWAVRNTTEGTSIAAPSLTASSARLAAPVTSDHQAAGQHARFSVTIRKPAGPPRVELGPHGALGGHDLTGKPVTVACSTCHAARPPNIASRGSADLDEFHQNLTFAHGQVTCLSCHNPRNYDTLHLADGSSVEYSEVMTLCAQCHGPKTRDYQHGAHGGMSGYWDLSRGPRTRNSCVDCHAPHAPRFPAMKPTFKPRDRFLSGAGSDEKGGDEEGPSGAGSHE
jgi:hypothetical protein